MYSMYGIAIASVLIFGVVVGGEPLENCEASRWQPAGSTPPDTPDCVEYDGSLIPDCKFFLNNHTSYFHAHEYNCSRFWECAPEGACLFDCAPCGTTEACGDFDGLVFDCRYQFPFGPVCDWPYNVDCTNHYPCEKECCDDEDCPNGQCVDGSCVAETCDTNTDCTATDCSTCENNVCANPECCSDDDCPNGQCVDGSCVVETCDANTDCTTTDCSTCENNVCANPECCSDDDCPTGYCAPDGTCAGECSEDSDCTSTTCSTCGDHMCADPECCSDDDCPNGVCTPDGKCEDWECIEDSDCTTTTCSKCGDHLCADPECCSDDDCPTGYCSPDGTCEGECDDNGDCQTLLTMDCSVCEDYICSEPECCTNDDCPDGYICEGNGCVQHGECDAERPCEGVNNMCDVPSYDNCEWCDLDDMECKQGCGSDSNCPEDKPNCVGHKCITIGTNGLVNITIATSTCSSCAGSGNPMGKVEGGVKLVLNGEYGTSCTSNGLDNLERVDYDNGKTAFFDGEPADDDDDDGLGGCKLADLNYGLTGGSATWTGPGKWTAADSQPICIKFYDPNNNKPTCCCELKQKTLSTDDTSDLENCLCA